MLDEKQIESLYAELAAKIVNYLVANGLDRSVSCDILQETFLRIWNKREELSSDDPLSGFAFAVARNLRADFLRKNRGVVFQEEISDADADSCSSPEDATDDLRYLRKRLKDALSQLPDEFSEAYVLTQVGKRSIREAAAILDISESLVKVRVHRAKEKLRELLRDLQDF